MKIKDIEIGGIYASRTNATYATPDRMRVVAVRVIDARPRYTRADDNQPWYREVSTSTKVAAEVLDHSGRVLRRVVYPASSIAGPYDEVVKDRERARTEREAYQRRLAQQETANRDEATRLMNGIAAGCGLRVRACYPDKYGNVSVSLDELKAIYESVTGDPAQEA